MCTFVCVCEWECVCVYICVHECVCGCMMMWFSRLCGAIAYSLVVNMQVSMRVCGCVCVNGSVCVCVYMCV